MSRNRRTTAGVAALLLGLLSVLIGPVAPATADSTAVPGQYIAKLYTEALGRLPYQSEWQSAAERFSTGGCNTQVLAEVGQQVYSSADFAQLGYDNASRLTTLYRGVLNSEPDPAEFAGWQSELDHGESWSSVVARFFVSDDFAALVPKICSGATDSSATSYAVAGQQAAELSPASAGFQGDEEELQSILDEAPQGSTVQLGQRALITLTKPLTVPEGVTLTTTATPDTREYARMGRLVRAGEFDAAMVNVADGGKLTGVWVDGARDSPGNTASSRINVRVLGGTETAVVGNKISNSAGAASIEVQGQSAGYQCSDVTVSDNVITAYSNDHYLTRQQPDGTASGTWSNGIVVDCGDTRVSGNQIVDTGGIGIAVHPATSLPKDDVDQHSTVVDNEILSAGIPMYGGIVADPEFFVAGKGEQRHYSFTGTKIAKNRIWSGPNTHLVIGIGAGTRAWWAGSAMVGAHAGQGVKIVGNDTGKVGARVRTGIAVSGMDDVELGRNPATWLHGGVPGQQGNSCPGVDVAVSESAGTGTVDRIGKGADLSYADVDFDGCVS